MTAVDPVAGPDAASLPPLLSPDPPLDLASYASRVRSTADSAIAVCAHLVDGAPDLSDTAVARAYGAEVVRHAGTMRRHLRAFRAAEPPPGALTVAHAELAGAIGATADAIAEMGRILQTTPRTPEEVVRWIALGSGAARNTLALARHMDAARATMADALAAAATVP